MEERNQFLKGEYIVIPASYNGSFLKNYIFKQREDYTYLRSELDCKNSTTNGLCLIEYINKDRWRYATPQEIKEYDRLGKPYEGL